MPCTVCGTLLVRYDDRDFCPKCNNIQLDRNKAIKDLDKNLRQLEGALTNLVKNRVDKNRLLDELARHREKFSRDFFDNYQAFDLTKFLSLNLLIFDFMREPFFHGDQATDYDEEVERISQVFSGLIQMKNNYLLFKNGLAEAVKTNGKMRIVPNERYFPIINSYEDNQIMVKTKAVKVIKQYKKIFNLIYKKDPKGCISYTPEEYVEHFYNTINQFYCALLRNEVYDEVFGLLQEYGKKGITPGKLMDFVNSYQMYDGTLSFTTATEFIARAKTKMNIEEGEALQLLVFSEKGASNFPMFISINDTVCISHRTSFLIYILMHAIFYKELFDKETEKRSKAFEKEEVRKDFESIGWTYSPNATDKKQQSIEIDGIATYKRKMLVVECKGWQPIRPFFEYEKMQEYLIRDIKGIVDGQKFTHGKPKTIPSLIEKVSFAKKKMSIWGFDSKDYDEINGIVVVRGYPPIDEYKGIQILSVSDIQEMYAPQTHPKTPKRNKYHF